MALCADVKLAALEVETTDGLERGDVKTRRDLFDKHQSLPGEAMQCNQRRWSLPLALLQHPRRLLYFVQFFVHLE